MGNFINTANIQNIIANVIGGIIVALLTIAIQFLRTKIKYRSFKKIFGNDLEENFKIIYPAYEPPAGITFAKPQPKVSRITAGTVNLETVNSTASSRAMSHLSYAIGRNSRANPIIKSDIETDEFMDISFISIGGLNNHKSVDLLDNASNTFITFSGNAIISKKSKKAIVRLKTGYDYGFVIKINPSHNPERTWLCCAGFAEWGTSGVSWWLSKYWKVISKQAKKRPFALITQTRIGSDDSTQKLHLFLSEQAVENETEL